ncbi:MAG: hypothetical protein DWH94_11885 [Planctomycetota bacterium]|nr:MAG: hypothetical protein DWH94_11885 [Planctomycetota bacterium]
MLFKSFLIFWKSLFLGTLFLRATIRQLMTFRKAITPYCRRQSTPELGAKFDAVMDLVAGGDTTDREIIAGNTAIKTLVFRQPTLRRRIEDHSAHDTLASVGIAQVPVAVPLRLLRSHKVGNAAHLILGIIASRSGKH